MLKQIYTETCQLTFKANFESRSLAGAHVHNVMIIEMHYTEKCITGSNTVYALCMFGSVHAHPFGLVSAVC